MPLSTSYLIQDPSSCPHISLIYYPVYIIECVCACVCVLSRSALFATATEPNCGSRMCIYFTMPAFVLSAAVAGDDCVQSCPHGPAAGAVNSRRSMPDFVSHRSNVSIRSPSCCGHYNTYITRHSTLTTFTPSPRLLYAAYVATVLVLAVVLDMCLRLVYS